MTNLMMKGWIASEKELIDQLVKEHNDEIGVDTDSDWAIEPFPIGTPKGDHRRCGDTDDGK